MKKDKILKNVWIYLAVGLLIGGILTFVVFPRIIEKTTYTTVEKIVPVEKIVYQDKIIYKDKIIEVTKLSCAIGSSPVKDNWVGSIKASACAIAHNRSAC